MSLLTLNGKEKIPRKNKEKPFDIKQIKPKIFLIEN